MRRANISPKFVEFVPEELEEGILYISEKHATALHKCCCGCGEEVVTPLSPADWQLRKHGGAVSLSPSIGNWNFECQSHYWIRRNRVEWGATFSKEEIRRVQLSDRLTKQAYIAERNASRDAVQLSWFARLWKTLRDR